MRIAKNFVSTRNVRVLFISILLLWGCTGKEGTAPVEPAPEIPPASTLIMDFAAFDTSGQLPKAGGFSALQQDGNWRWAALKVGVWNALILLNFALPVAAFGESFRHEPSLQDDGSWLWSYNFGIGNSAKLRARLQNGEVHWEMQITRPNQFTDFTWFTGVSNLTATEGTWRLFAAPNNPVPYIDVVWHRNPGAGTADIQYTNVLPGHPGNGGYIFYGIINDPEFNAVYNIFHIETNNLSNIAWNRTDFHGRIKDPQHFGDADWHCWDTRDNGLADIPCP